MITTFPSLAFCQVEVNAIEAPPFTLSNLKGGTTSLQDAYTEAKAVVVLFIRVNAATQAQGRQLARHLENEYREKWKGIPAKVLIVAHGDLNSIQQATDGIALPILHGTDEVLKKYDVVGGFALYIICVQQASGMIIARFDAPADIQSEKVDVAVKSCAISDNIISAFFDEKAEKNVFKKPDGSLLTNSEIFTGGMINYSFSSEKRVGGTGASIEISFPGSSKGSFSIILFGADLSQAGYLTMWILGSAGAEQFHIAIEDRNGVANQLLVSDYIRVLRSRWQRISVPLTYFNDGGKARPTIPTAKLSPLDFKAISSVSLRFNPSFGEATVYVDDLSFYKGGPAEQISGTTQTQKDVGSGEISISITEPPKSGVYPSKGVIKGIVKGLEQLSTSERKQYKVVIYSETDAYYVQPFENNPYTAIRKNDKWSANIFLADSSYAALLVKKTGSKWPSWPSPVRSLPEDVEDVEIIDVDQVEPD